ncbi:DJ-1/PfpI family protein [Methylobacter sp. BlB1]|uniref:DJ-1/PfpI family protein n=1 Tax=Methylobacter sp. BlB1 TaxID=2785914 RepID=UPI001893B417|nr:DJ-1/PfpI family protein [Methylobacter sp. BlB1]MBF6649919.1 DJ-1/PfpI family protein [Methylobacter sp. BlB1]
MDRRQFTKLALFAAFLAPLGNSVKAAENDEQRKIQAQSDSMQAHKAFMSDPDVKMMGNEKIAMLLYPGFYAPDLINPQFLFTAMMGAEVYLISPTDDLTPVSCGNFSIVPTHRQSECPEKLDILFVPGGAAGTLAAMKNKPFIDFIKTKAANSRYIASVCTGSLLLGKAGLLKGKKATSHWTTLELLKKFGATPVSERVVWDGNLVTGGGVTAGIDLGLQIVGALRGKEYAEAIQLQAEYDPAPPYNAGSPGKAPAFVRDSVRGMFAPLVLDMELEI